MILSLALAAAPAGPAPPAPRFDPIRFFSGETQGQGRLKVILRRAVPVRVEGRGQVAADGALVLDQRIEQGDKRPRDRRWRIRQVAPGRYAGTLTDAVGPITGTAKGDRLHLAFTMKGGYEVDQQLILAADGRSARNVMVIRKLGLRVARLDEVIRKRD